MSSAEKHPKKPPKAQRLKAVLPEVWKLMRPRRRLLALGFVLMVINRVAGFVLPYSTKFLIDDVISKHHIVNCCGRWSSLFWPATLVQGVTSFSLTQLLSKAAQRLIADLAPAGAGSHFAAARLFLRCQQNRHVWSRAS